MPLQLQLPTRDPRIALPVVDLAGAFAILSDARETEITDLADCGFIWAWNVGDRDARRIEWRFLARSVSAIKDCWRDCLVSTAPAVRAPAAWPEVLKLMLPKHTKPWFTAREVKRALNLRRQHFINLVESHQLPGTGYRRGPSGSPAIARADFIKFLETRCIGGTPC